MVFEAGRSISQSNVPAAHNTEESIAAFKESLAKAAGNGPVSQHSSNVKGDGGPPTKRGGREETERGSRPGNNESGPDGKFDPFTIAGRHRRDDGGPRRFDHDDGHGRDKFEDFPLPHGPQKGPQPWQAYGYVPGQWQGYGWGQGGGYSGNGNLGVGFIPDNSQDADDPWQRFLYGRGSEPWDPQAAIRYVLAREVPGVRAPHYTNQDYRQAQQMAELRPGQAFAGGGYHPDMVGPFAFGPGRGQREPFLDGSLASGAPTGFFTDFSSIGSSNLDWLQLKLTIFTRTSEEGSLVRFMRAQGCSPEQVLEAIWGLRQAQLMDGWSEPGSAYASAALRPADASWLGGAETRASWIPSQLANHLRARHFNDFMQFRAALWRAAADTPEIATQFSEANLARMRNGMAPVAPSSQQTGDLFSYLVFHQVPVSEGGGLYDLSNIVILSPFAFQSALDPTNPYSILNFMYAAAARLKRRRRRRWLAGKQQQRRGQGGAGYSLGRWARRKWMQFRQREGRNPARAAPRRPAPGLPVVRLTRQGPEPLVKVSASSRRRRSTRPPLLSWRPSPPALGGTPDDDPA